MLTLKISKQVNWDDDLHLKFNVEQGYLSLEILNIETSLKRLFPFNPDKNFTFQTYKQFSFKLNSHFLKIYEFPRNRVSSYQLLRRVACKSGGRMIII